MSATIVLAGGGSGGHLSPGLAVAERLHALAPEIKVVFACSEREVDRMMLENAGANWRAIPAAPFSIRPKSFVRMVSSTLRGTREAGALLDEIGATIVLAMGGYVSVPVVRAARKRSIPVVLLNLDAVPGRANRWVAGHADKVRTAVRLHEASALEDAELVGFPVRRVALAPTDKATCRERLGLEPATATLLVTGASQGASSLNALMRLLVTDAPEAFSGWQLVHLSGKDDRNAMVHTYSQAGIVANVTSFLDQMGLAWGAADLALSRAGANSVAEALANAVPTLFVPYPFHHDLHQKFNAEPLVRVGGAALAMDSIDVAMNRHSIGAPLIDLLTDPGRRIEMQAILQAQDSVDGASEVARLLLENGS